MLDVRFGVLGWILLLGCASTPRASEATIASHVASQVASEGKVATDVSAPAADPLGRDAKNPKSTPLAFDGVWKTSYGTMRLATVGESITGSYSYGGGASVAGRIVEGELHLVYREPDGTTGRALFQLNENADRFDGVWEEGDSNTPLSLEDRDLARWTGERIVPIQGRRWLVILEVHWEEGLAVSEYSYGAMLRSYFARLPDVEVRHRFVHDRADLVRFLNEIAELPEPAIVYVSSHGTKEGVQTAAGTIDGTTIGEALRNSGAIDLLHFGACSAMKGDFATRIATAAAPHAPFPISGYRRDADWAGSAILDFAFLGLVLEHGMNPRDAVSEVRRTIEFAGDVDRKGAAIAPIDLVIR